jgi:hypothetical protein
VLELFKVEVGGPHLDTSSSNESINLCTRSAILSSLWADTVSLLLLKPSHAAPMTITNMLNTISVRFQGNLLIFNKTDLINHNR